MINWNTGLLQRWFVAARADAVGTQPLRVLVLDRPLMLARLPSGQLFVLEDRCPHRQAPLSAGRVTAQGIECPYHGWRFGTDGRCTAVPGQAPDACVPRVGARAIDACELDGLVWVRLASHGDSAPPRMIGELPAGSRRFLWQTSWGAHVVDAIENFLDPLHTHSIHPGLVRNGDARTRMQARLSPTDEGFMIDYSGHAEQSGILYRLFESPRLSEQAHFAGAGSAQIVYRYVNGSVVRISLHFTPESAQRTHVFTTLHVENRWAPAWAVRLFVWPLLKRVALQDQRILELQAQNMLHFPHARGVSTGLDLVRDTLEKIWAPDAATPAPVTARETIIFL